MNIIGLYVSNWFTLDFFCLKEIFQFHKSSFSFFFYVQMQTAPFPKPHCVEFSWILPQLHTVKRIGLRPLSKSRCTGKIAEGIRSFCTYCNGPVNISVYFVVSAVLRPWSCLCCVPRSRLVLLVQECSAVGELGPASVSVLGAPGAPPSRPGSVTGALEAGGGQREL